MTLVGLTLDAARCRPEKLALGLGQTEPSSQACRIDRDDLPFMDRLDIGSGVAGQRREARRVVASGGPPESGDGHPNVIV